MSAMIPLGPPSLLDGSASQLAIELAARLEPPRLVIARYGLAPQEYRRLLSQASFRELIRQAAIDFAGLANTASRIKLKSQMVIEQTLSDMHSLILDPLAVPGARVSAFAAVRALTGLEKPEPTAGTPQKFSLTINLPGDGAVRSPGVSNGSARELVTIEHDPS